MKKKEAKVVEMKVLRSATRRFLIESGIRSSKDHRNSPVAYLVPGLALDDAGLLQGAERVFCLLSALDHINIYLGMLNNYLSLF